MLNVAFKRAPNFPPDTNYEYNIFGANGQEYGYGITKLNWGPDSIYYYGGETAGCNSNIGYDPANKVTLIIWSNLTVDLDEMTTANTLMLKVLDQIYAVSPLAPTR